ncbi:MAG TPA: DUF4157 domain-containing protein [Myxococcales bacterium]
MMQASLQVAALDRRLEEERRRDGLGPFLQPWVEAAAGLRAALGKARANLEAHGTAREHLERIERRLEALQRRAAAFDVAADLDECAASWGHLAHDIAALSGPRRDELLHFLAARKDAIDRATAGLSQARNAGGVHPEQRARLRAVEDERERARERYARLRDDYLRAARGHGTPHPSGALAPVVVTLPELLAPRGALRSASPGLDALIERDRHLRVGVAQRFEKTLGSLATAGHRTLTDPRAGELQGHLAHMDGILARLQGKRSASELSDGAREVGGLLAQMGDLASARGSAAALKPFRALLEERRAALARLAGEAQKAAGAQARNQRGALPQPSAIALGEKQLQTLRKLHPGIETLLRDASASQLAAELRRPEAHSPLERAQGRLGAAGLAAVGQAIAFAHLGGFGGARGGGLGALRAHGAIGRAPGAHRGSGPAHAHARELHELLGTLGKAPPGSPLHQIAVDAEDRRRQIAERAKARLHGRGPAHGAARALGEAFHAHGRGDFAAHVAPGGALYHLLQGAQRSHGLPVPHLASHFLQSRGAHPLAGTMQLFDRLSAEGYRPHLGLFSRLKHVASDAFHTATTTIAHTTADAARTASGLAKAAGATVRSGISDLGHQALDAGQRVAATVRGAAGNVGRTVGRAVGSGARSLSRALQQGAQFAGREASALRQATGRAVTRVTRTVRDVVHGGVDRVTQLGAAVMQRAGEAGRQVSRFGERALHTGLDALHRTGIAGGIGKGVRFGLSMMKTAAKYSPVGLALQGFQKAGGLQGIWEKTKHTAGAAWQGVQKAYHATAGFLQSPAGQLLVTGLSLAATFIPGGVVVKSIVGGAIGAIQAASEGRDLKHVLLAAGTGALTGALPFLKVGPLAQAGIGALTGAATALASGGSLKDAVKGAGAGALDSFDPGALKALGRLKGLKGAQKILQGKQLSKLERLAIEGSHLKGPLSGLEKLMGKRSMRRVVGGLSKACSKGVKGGILLSGKAAKAQGYLDKALAMGDRLEGGLSLVHQLAPEVAGAVGDNALGDLISKAGDYAGEGDDRLKRALEMGHGASDKLQRYRGYLDKGLGYAGVKDPKKAYGRMMARKDAREGKREGIEAVAQDKLARHRLRHPELHEALRAPRRIQLEGRAPRRHEPRTALEKALARGKALKRQGLEVVQGAHDGLHKIYGTVGKGLEYAGHVEGGLERAAALARQGAGVFGEHSELGAYLSHVADRADLAHGYLEQRIGFARDFNERVGKVEGGLERVPGVGPEGAPKRRKKIHDAPELEHLQGGVPAARAEVAHESDEERSRRLTQSWNAIGSVSRQVQRFELESARRLRKAHELGAKDQTDQALHELMGLGLQVDEIAKRIGEAKRLARGNEKYEKEIAFYEDWQQKARASVHSAIAGGKDLGKHVGVSGQGISEQTHPDVYRNTRDIFAVQGKVIAFAGALGDDDARSHVEKVLAEARAAKSELRSLQAKYERDRGARDFLADGTQDRLIDQSIAKLEKALRRGGKAEPKAAKAPKTGGLRKSAEQGLAKVQQLQKSAVRTGRKLDRKLGMVEGKFRRGIAAGRKVEHGLEEVSRVAGTLGDLFGDDSAIGHFADQVHDSADKGHDKLHGALQVAARGKKGLHEGRKLLEEALQLGAQRHVEKGHRERPHDAEGPVGRGHPEEPEREHVRVLDRAGVDGAHPPADAQMAVQAAAHAVAHFGGAVDGAVKAVQKLLERDRGAEAAERIRSVEELSDQAAAAVKDAARAAASDPALAGRAAKLRDHLQEIRAHFRQFVSGLRGLESKDAALDRERAGQRDGHPRHRPGGRRGRRPQGDLVDEVLRGIDDGRIFVDRGAQRGERPEHDGQDVDPAAIDSWIGSGEGVKLFSDVFGAFLPAEGAAGRRPRQRRLGGHGSRGGQDHRDQAPQDDQRPGRRRGKGGFFAKVFEKVEDFAEDVAHVAHAGAGLLGKAMHYAETGMHGLNVVEHAAEKAHDLAGKAEGFLYRIHLGSAAGFAHQVGAAAGWVDARAEEAHGGLKTADEALGEGKHDLEGVESFGHSTAKVAHKARKGHFGDLLHLFRATTDGDGTDGRLRPEQVRLGSPLDEPRRLDALTQARMEQFLGGDFTGVRVHVGPGAAQITSRYAAEAVTVKDHIFFAPGKFSPGSAEGEKLLAHELTHVLQKGRKNLDVRTAEAEALHAEHSYGSAPAMETLNLSRPAPDFKLPDGEGAPASDGIHTAKRTRSRGDDAGGKDDLPDGEEFLEKVSSRVYDLLMDELEQSFESR